MTKMLPSFPLTSAGSDEDLLSNATDLDSVYTMGGSVYEASMIPSPTQRTPASPFTTTIDVSGKRHGPTFDESIT